MASGSSGPAAGNETGRFHHVVKPSLSIGLSVIKTRRIRQHPAEDKNNSARASRPILFTLSPERLEQIGLELRLARINGANMKSLARLMWTRFGLGCNVGETWKLLTYTATPGRLNFQDRDPGKKGGPRNPRRKSSWHTYPRTIGRGL